MKSKLIVTLSTIAISASLVIGGTLAAFSDYGTSNNNLFTAGTLDLTVDGQENHDAKFNVSNMRPGNQPTGQYTLKNVGTHTGYLNLSNISVTNIENDLTPPEALAGDKTADVGELGDVLNVRLYLDNDGSGYFSTGDVMFYDGKVSDIPSSFKLNKEMAPNSIVKINAVFDWWDTANDNKAQSDSMNLDLRFDLTQNAK